MISSAWRKWRTPLALGLALTCCSFAGAARAQMYFRPFVHSFHYDIPPDDDDDYEAPRFASRRAVGRILAREGFQLVGPLGRRGDQIVATGVSPRDGETRFFIDPFEGQIIRAVTLGPPPARLRREPDDGYIPPLGGSRPVARDIGRDREPPAEARMPDRSRRSAARAPEREAPLTARPERREAVTPPPVAPAPAPGPVAAPAPKPAKPVDAKPIDAARQKQAPAAAQAAKPVEKPIEWAKPAEIAKPAEAAKPVETAKPVEPAPKPVAARSEPAPAKAVEPVKPATIAAPPAKETVKPVAAAPAVAAPRPAPKTTAARSTGGSSYRAIVPPKAAEGTSVVTPAAPATSTARTPGGARTPQSVAMPKAE